MTIAKDGENKFPSDDRNGAIPPIQKFFSSECLRYGTLAIGVSAIAEAVPNVPLKGVIGEISFAVGGISLFAGAFLKLVRGEIVAVTPELGRQIVAERLSRTSFVCGDYGAFFKHSGLEFHLVENAELKKLEMWPNAKNAELNQVPRR